MHDGGAPGPDDGGGEGGTPECETAEPCFIGPDGITRPRPSRPPRPPPARPSRPPPPRACASGSTPNWPTTGTGRQPSPRRPRSSPPWPCSRGSWGSGSARSSATTRTSRRPRRSDTFVAAGLRRALARPRRARSSPCTRSCPCSAAAPNDACKTEIAKKYPLLDPDRVGAWLAKGLVDQLALDSGHLATEYTTWKIDAATAQRNQWIQVRARAWDAYAQIAAEDAGFTTAGSAQLTAEQATTSITDRVAAPLQDDAAETVTLWSRWRDAQGQISRAYGEKWAANTTWDQLKKLTPSAPAWPPSTTRRRPRWTPPRT